METKYLWDIIDKLRDELNIASDGITDLNDVLKDEKYYISEYEKKAKAEIKELKLLSCTIDCHDNVNSLIKLQAEIKELKAEVEKYRTDNKWLANRNGEIIKREKKAIDELQAEIKELKAELDKVKRCNKTMDGILLEREEENEDLRKGCKLLKDTSHYPKEYKAEAEEYFHHVPEGKEVYFFMLSEWEMKDGESGDLMIDKDNAICVINNEEVLTND